MVLADRLLREIERVRRLLRAQAGSAAAGGYIRAEVSTANHGNARRTLLEQFSNALRQSPEMFVEAQNDDPSIFGVFLISPDVHVNWRIASSRNLVSNSLLRQPVTALYSLPEVVDEDLAFSGLRVSSDDLHGNDSNEGIFLSLFQI